MTAREVLNSALKLLGYTDTNLTGELPMRILNRAVSVINVIYSELYRAEKGENFTPIKCLSEQINLSDEVLSEIMPSGVAMLISGGESDGDSQSLWAEIYNRKKSILTKTDTRTDLLPCVEGLV